MLISANEYAEKHGYNAETVRRWCQEGNLPGARKMYTERKGPTSWMYMIPEDAEPMRPLRKYQKDWGKQEAAAQEAAEDGQKQEVMPLKHLKTRHDKCEHIRKHCISKTYSQLMRETGMTHAEIRKVYDRLHEVYGI